MPKIKSEQNIVPNSFCFVKGNNADLQYLATEGLRFSCDSNRFFSRITIKYGFQKKVLPQNKKKS